MLLLSCRGGSVLPQTEIVAVEGKVRMGHGPVAPLTWYAPLMGIGRGDMEGIGGTHATLVI